MSTASGATVEDTPAVRTGRTRSATKVKLDVALRFALRDPADLAGKLKSWGGHDFTLSQTL
jgi:hypothetical protein